MCAGLVDVLRGEVTVYANPSEGRYPPPRVVPRGASLCPERLAALLPEGASRLSILVDEILSPAS